MNEWMNEWLPKFKDFHIKNKILLLFNTSNPEKKKNIYIYIYINRKK